MELGVRILRAVFTGFLLGIFLRSLVPLGISYAWLMLLLALTLFALSFLDMRRMHLYVVVSVGLLTCGMGILRMDGAVLERDVALDSMLEKKVVVEGIVASEPDVRENQVRITIDAFSAASTSVSARVLAALPPHVPVSYGERVKVSGTLRLPEAFDAGEGREFDYPGYLASQGILYQLDFAQLEEVGDFAGNRGIAFALGMKRLFVSGLERALPEPHAGLAAGLTAGEKRALGSDLSEEFRIVSLIHIVVLSGYNITIVINALFRVLRRAPRPVRFGAGVLVAIFFAVMTGFASASMRAAIMAGISISGTLSGRIYRPGRALALAGIVMLLWDPYLLVFDPGFQLSFLATAGLIAFSPLFEVWYGRISERFALREILISSSSAQIAVLPLLLYQSGTLSLVALPANLLALLAVPWAMLTALIAALGGLIAGPLAPLFGFPAYALLSYILGVAHVLASVPFAAVSVLPFGAWLLVPIYAGLFGYALWRISKNPAPVSTKGTGAGQGIY